MAWSWSRSLIGICRRVFSDSSTRVFSRSIGLVGVIVQQVIVALDAVVDSFGGMKLEIFFEVVNAEISKGRHGAAIPSKSPPRNFPAVAKGMTCLNFPAPP